MWYLAWVCGWVEIRLGGCSKLDQFIELGKIEWIRIFEFSWVGDWDMKIEQDYD